MGKGCKGAKSGSIRALTNNLRRTWLKCIEVCSLIYVDKSGINIAKTFHNNSAGQRLLITLDKLCDVVGFYFILIFVD